MTLCVCQNKEAQWNIMLGQSLLTLTTAKETLLPFASRYAVTWKRRAALCTDGANAMVSNKNDCSLPTCAPDPGDVGGEGSPSAAHGGG